MEEAQEEQEKEKVQPTELAEQQAVPAEQPKPKPKACAKKKVVCKKTLAKKKEGEEEEEEEFEYEEYEIEEMEEEAEEEEQEIEQPIRQWDEIPTEEQLALCRRFVDILMDIGTQNRIIGLIVKACKKKQSYLDYYPTKCLRREIVALKYSINLENERKEKYLLQMKNFLGKTPYGPWDFVTFTTKSLDNPETELCMGLNDYICGKLAECPDGVCKEKNEKLCLSESFFTFD